MSIVTSAQGVAYAESSAGFTCIQPATIFKWEDYQGPLRSAVGLLARGLEHKPANRSRYKPGTVLCSVKVKDKFTLFVRDTFDPFSLVSPAVSAGMDQSANRDPSYGEGASGYARRFGASLASQTSARFFGGFVYPTLFSEDPRYYPLIHGSGRHRFLHAVQHTFVARHESGKGMFNASKWLGTATSVSLGEVLHPGTERGLTPALKAGGYSLAVDMGFDVLREFWPDIARKFRMPFRASQDAVDTKSSF